MNRSKKASSWYPTFIVMAGLVALTACWIILLNKGGTFERTIGESQFMLISAYQKGENYMLFMDQAGKYSASQAALALASGGGYSGDSSCGSIAGYAIWNSASRDCYPDEAQLEASYTKRFTQALGSYSGIYLNNTADLGYSLEFLGKEPLIMIVRPNRSTYILLYPDGTTSMALGEVIDYAALEAGLPAKAAAEKGMPGEVS